MGEVISRPEFRHWEIHDSEPRLNFDLDCYDETPQLKLSDMIHSASFRNGLSNTLYAPRFNLHNIDGNVLKQFRSRNFTLNRLTLVGLGVSHDDMLKYAEFFRLPGQADGAARKAEKFLGSNDLKFNLIQIEKKTNVVFNSNAAPFCINFSSLIIVRKRDY